jgi:dephospho-CoA kinase
MIRIGITGIIGSGKSTVSALLRKKGFCVVDLDGLAKEMLGRPEVVIEIEKALGAGYVRDGKADVEELRRRAFMDKDVLRRLEGVIHPRVRAEMERRAEEERGAAGRAFIVDAPLLFEKGLQKELDRIVVVSADMERIKERLKQRGMEEDDVEKRIPFQIPLKEKERMADYVIHNNGDMEDLEREVSTLLERIKVWEVTVHAS